MKFGPVVFKDKIGREVILCHAEVEDASNIIDYLKVTTGETPFLIREPEEVAITLEQEQTYIRSVMEDPDELMLVAIIAEKHVGNCCLMKIGNPVFASDYEDHWAKEAIERWEVKEVLNGYEDGTFRPKQAMTRAELAKIIVELFGLNNIQKAKTYTDVDPKEWYASYIAAVSSAGIMNDEGTVFKPNEAATREEAAYAIAMAYKITNGSVSFNDTDAISDWALDKIDALAANGYINGRPDGNFAPKETLTRADVITMIDKITAELINKAGTYDQSIKGNLVVRIGDVTLKDMNVSGNLYIAEGVGEGDITLENVQVNGKVFVEGGGAHSLKVLGTSKIGEMIVGKANDKPVRIYVEKGSAIHRLDIASGCILEGKGNFEQVNLKTSSLLQINGVEVKSLAINTTGFITMDKETTIGYLECNSKLDLAGSGKIKEAIIKASDCKIDVKPEKVDFATKDITATIAANKTSSSGTNTRIIDI